MQSRYYDARTCRFINADDYVSTGQGLIGNNMFAYCGNNPVNCIDPTGDWWQYVAVALIVVGLVVSLTSSSAKTDVNAKLNYVNSETEKKDGEINYNIYYVEINGETVPCIRIYDSTMYTSSAQKRKILKIIINSPEGQKFGLSENDIDYYIDEWSVHNFAMQHPKLASMVIRESVESIILSSINVDLNVNDSHRDFYFRWGGLANALD